MPVYEGSVPISTLAYRPLHLLPQRQQIWDTLLARADRQLSFMRSPYKIQEHEGEGVVFGTPDTPSWEQKEPRRFYVSMQCIVRRVVLILAGSFVDVS